MKRASILIIASLSLGVCQPALGQTSTSAGGGIPRPAGRAAPKLELGPAWLGMTLAQWRALRRADEGDGHVSASCTGVAGGDGAGPLKIAASAPPRSAEVCSYIDRYGRIALPQSIALTSTYRTSNPEYYFVGGALSKIEFRVSIDAFNALVAQFRARYGWESRTVRDSVTASGMVFPRVQKVWRLPNGSIRIVDPSSRYNDLLVRYESPGADNPSAS